MHRERAKLDWSPQWEGPIKNWALKHIRKNRWRCDRIHERDDLLQEAHLIFMKLCLKYPRVTTPGNFMALFKTSFSNYIHDRSSYLQRKQACHVELHQDVSDVFSESIGETTNSGYLAVLLSEAPDELQMALTLIAENPQLLRADPTNEPRENLNMKLRRILGLRADFDFKAAMLSLIKE